MNISPKENMQMAVYAVWSHKFRSLLTVLGIVIGITTVVTVASLLTGLREGVVVFFQTLGPDNIFLYRTSGDPSQDPQNPKERRRRPLKPEYADYIKRWCSSVADTGVIIYIPSVVDGNPLIAKVPGYESDTVNVNGLSTNMYDLSPRDFDAGRFFTAEEDQRAAHVAIIGRERLRFALPRQPCCRSHVYAGWRGVHGDRSLFQSEGRILRREWAG